MNSLIEWCEKQKKRQIPTLPKLGSDVQASSAVKSEDKEKVSGTALDNLLYGDINPSLNLNEILNVHKEASQPKEN